MALAFEILVCLALVAAGIFGVRTLNPKRPRHRWVNPRITPALLRFYWVLSVGLIFMAVVVGAGCVIVSIKPQP